MNAWFRAIALGVVLSVSTSPVWVRMQRTQSKSLFSGGIRETR